MKGGSNLNAVLAFLLTIFEHISGLGMEGKCMGQGKGDTNGALHSGAEQTSIGGWSRHLHPNHQQRHGV